jgi:hypothetical protein
MPSHSPAGSHYRIAAFVAGRTFSGSSEYFGDTVVPVVPESHPRIGSLFISLTKSSGGNIAVANDKIELDVSFDGSTWSTVKDAVGSATNLNLLTGISGVTDANVSAVVSLAPFMRLRLVDVSGTAVYVTTPGCWLAY